MPSGSGCCLPASMPPMGERLARSWLALLWYSLNPLFCEWARFRLRLQLFPGKFSLSLFLFFFLSLAFPQFGLLSHVSSLRFSSGHSGPKHATRASLFSPRLLVADANIWATSPLGVAVRCIYCGLLFFFPVLLPSEIPKLPTDPPVREFPGV